MLTVGRDISSSRASRQLTSCTQWSTPSSFLAAPSSRRRAASAIIASSAAESGRALSAKPSMAGSLPSGETSVARASTRCHAGLSTLALLLEWMRSEEHTSELQSPCNLVCRLIISEENTSELQSPCNLVCRLLLEKKKTKEFLFHRLVLHRVPKHDSSGCHHHLYHHAIDPVHVHAH